VKEHIGGPRIAILCVGPTLNNPAPRHRTHCYRIVTRTVLTSGSASSRGPAQSGWLAVTEQVYLAGLLSPSLFHTITTTTLHSNTNYHNTTQLHHRRYRLACRVECAFWWTVNCKGEGQRCLDTKNSTAAQQPPQFGLHNTNGHFQSPRNPTIFSPTTFFSLFHQHLQLSPASSLGICFVLHRIKHNIHITLSSRIEYHIAFDAILRLRVTGARPEEEFGSKEGTAFFI
jgi:hypothetical protein